jgi:Xaa-Pro aminopeptidase
MLTAEGCRARQRRLIAEMAVQGWDLFLTGDRFTSYYLSGSLAPPESPVYFALRDDGSSVLVTPGNREGLAVDEVVELELYSPHRCVTQPHHDGARLLLDRVRPTAHTAVECSGTPALFPTGHDATAAILRLRKRKHDDEIDEIRAALRLCAVAYDTARATIAPGRTEIDIHNAMQAAVTREAGTPVQLRGDFACGERGIKEGGPPTARQIRPGDLYILDLFPAPALYFGDTCRTFAVDAPSRHQMRAWELVRHAVRLAESMVRPGVRAADVHVAVKKLLDAQSWTERSFRHHTGHGIGHRGHEAPRIIAESPDVFEEGDVITLEPGVYTAALQGGIRLEDNYVVRSGGLENLFDYPMGLVR